MDESADVSRRALLRGVAGATAASTAAGTAAAQETDTESGGGTDSGTADGTASGDDGGDGGGGGGGGNQRPVRPEYLSGAVDAGYEDLRGQSSVTIQVGADPDQLAFAPTLAWISPGTEVTFEWVSNDHNVMPNERPEGAGWEPHETLEQSGFTYSTTVETAGMHTYYCRPHESLGMKGALAVGDAVETETIETPGGGNVPQVPDAAKSLGIAAAFAMSATLGLAYFFIKYGGNYGESDAA